MAAITPCLCWCPAVPLIALLLRHHLWCFCRSSTSGGAC